MGVDNIHSRPSFGPDLSMAKTVKTHPAEEKPVTRDVVAHADPQIRVPKGQEIQTGPTTHVQAHILPLDHPSTAQNLYLGGAEKIGILAITGAQKAYASAHIPQGMDVEKAQQIGHHRLDLPA